MEGGEHIFVFISKCLYVVHLIGSNLLIVNSKINGESWYKSQTIQNIYNNGEEVCYCIKKSNIILGIITLYPEYAPENEETSIKSFRVNMVNMIKVEKMVWENFLRWAISNFFDTEEFILKNNRIFLEMETISKDEITQEMQRLGFQDTTTYKNSEYRFWDKEVSFS